MFSKKLSTSNQTLFLERYDKCLLLLPNLHNIAVMEHIEMDDGTVECEHFYDVLANDQHAETCNT